MANRLSSDKIVIQVRQILSKDKNLIKNFIALGLIQVTNLLIPLITFPYLVRIIGVEKFGVISYGLTIINYLIAVADYGFNISATRLASLNRGNSDKLSELFSNVMTTKLVLFVVSFIIMGFLCVTVDRIQHDSNAYMLGMLCVMGNVLMPVWFFQGLEKMKFITIANLIAKVLQLILLFLYVKSQNDYVFVLGIYGLGNILSGIYGVRLAVKTFNVRLSFSNLYRVWDELKNGWYFFSSTLTTSLANTVTIVVLGYFVSNNEIGYYSLAERVVLVAWSVLGLYSQAIYPTTCGLAQKSFSQVYLFVKKVTIPLFVLTAVGCVLIYMFADEITHLIAGHEVEESAYLLRILIVVPFIVALNIPAYQVLLAYNHKRAYAMLFNGSAIVNIVLCTGLVYIWGVVGAAICMVVVQTFITLSLYAVLAFKLKLMGQSSKGSDLTYM